MGCGSSKEAGAQQRPRPAGGQRPARPAQGRQQGRPGKKPQKGAPLNIGSPQDVTIHIPRNRANKYGVVIPPTTYEIERPMLEQALVSMAAFFHQKNTSMTVVAVGGAVNTIYLKTRNSTHDVDIFGTNLDNRARMLLDEARQHVIQQSRTPLGTDWINTETQMWMSPPLHRDLTNRALQQNVVVFSRPGLKVLAAPWDYAFSAKINRVLTKGNQVRPYDLADAAHYLRQYNSRRGGRPIAVATVEGWAKQYHHSTDRKYLMNTVNAEYQRLYKTKGIV